MEIHQITLCSPSYNKPLTKAQINIGIIGYKPNPICTTIVGLPYLNGFYSIPTYTTEISEIGIVIMGWFNRYNPAPQQFRINMLNQLKDYAFIRKTNSWTMRHFWLNTSGFNASLIATYIAMCDHLIIRWGNYIQLLEHEIIIISNENAH